LGSNLDFRKNPSTVSVILGGGRGTRLYPLTKERSKPAVPLGGKYRLIDVPISNCLNSQLNRIYILTQFNSASLHHHVSRSYRFDRFSGGFVEILAAEQTPDSEQWYQGTADAVRRNMVHFGDWDEMLILSGDQLYRMDFRRLLANHRRTNADISIAVLPVEERQASGLGILKVDGTGRVVAFHEKPRPDQLKGLETQPELYAEYGIQAAGRPYLASMGIYVYNRRTLEKQLLETSYVDFGRDVFPSSLKSQRVQAFLFDGYWEDIGTVRSFHEANLQMADPHPKFPFYHDDAMVFTAARMLPPTRIGKVNMENSLIADGCRVGDSTLKRCVLGIRSIVGKNVFLSRTLVMGADYYETAEQIRGNAEARRPNVGIGDDVIIEDAIIDKNVRIGSNVIIRNPESVEPKETDLYVVRDGVICVVKSAVVPSGTRIGK
jgi:glucose-1-phosphate adenylyltransferase